jgi:hypothetical protein
VKGCGKSSRAAASLSLSFDALVPLCIYTPRGINAAQMNFSYASVTVIYKGCYLHKEGDVTVRATILFLMNFD